MEMILDDEVGTFRNRQRQTRRLHMRLRPYRPTSHRLRVSTRLHAAETRLRTLRRAVVRFAVRIRKIEHMMDDGSRGRLHVDGRDPFIFREPQGHGDIAIDVGTVSRNMIRGRHFDDQIRLAEHPARSELRRRGRGCILAFRHALLHPFADERNLALFEPALVLECIRPGFGLPGRHESRGGHRGDGFTAFGNILIGKQRKRRCLTGAMARRAVVIDNGRDLLVERDGLGREGRTRNRKQGDQPHRRRQRSSAPQVPGRLQRNVRFSQNTNASPPRILRGMLISTN